MTLSLIDEACPVSLTLLGRLYRADADELAELVADIPEPTRARLAVYLYGRSHTHELGLRIAAGCEGSTLRRVAGLVGNALHEQSRQRRAGTGRPPSRPGVSLGGSAGLAYHGP